MEVVNVKFVLRRRKILCLYRPEATKITAPSQISFILFISQSLRCIHDVVAINTHSESVAKFPSNEQDVQTPCDPQKNDHRNTKKHISAVYSSRFKKRVLASNPWNPSNKNTMTFQKIQLTAVTFTIQPMPAHKGLYFN